MPRPLIVTRQGDRGFSPGHCDDEGEGLRCSFTGAWGKQQLRALQTVPVSEPAFSDVGIPGVFLTARATRPLREKTQRIT